MSEPGVTSMTALDRDVLGIIGAGSFGLGLAYAMARAGRRVILLTTEPSMAALVRTTRRSPRLPEVVLPDAVQITSDVAAFAHIARFMVLAVSSTNVDERLDALAPHVTGRHVMVHALGATSGAARISDVICQRTPILRVGVLAGPALPRDLVSATGFASMVVASRFAEVIAEGRRLLNAPPVLRIYGSPDLVGVEIASALSGVYSLALGLVDGNSLGIGPRAVLVTRALAESIRLGVALGGEAKTFSGLSWLGNLLVRAGGPEAQSPEYAYGVGLARGQASEVVPEAVRAVAALRRLADGKGVRMPLLAALGRVLAGELSAHDAARLAGESVDSRE